MNKNFLTILMIFGIYILLYSLRILLLDVVIDQKEYVSYKRNDEFKKDKNCRFNEKRCLQNLDIQIKNNTKVYSIAFGIGCILLVASLFWYLRLQYAGINILAKKRVIIVRFIEVIVNIGYWSVIGFLFFAMQMLVKQRVSGCVIESMFLFYISGFVGFYCSYFYLTNKYLALFYFGKYLLMCFLVILFVFLLGYFIPFCIKDIVNLKMESFTNPMFFQGFNLMVFFIFANILMGSIVKGFINWLLRDEI